MFALACVFLACTQPLPTTPDDGPLLAQATGEITVTYECGNTFLFRNRSLDTLTLAWRVRGNHEAGTIFLSARPNTAEFSEARVTTTIQGPLQVLRAGRELQTVPNGHGAGCPVVVDTFPSLPPESISTAFRDSIFAPENLVTDGQGPTRVPKNIVAVAFRPGTTVDDRAAAVRAVGGIVVGGYRYDANSYYYVKVPATGDEASLAGYIEQLKAQPAVSSALPLVVFRTQGLRPQDGVGWTSWSFQGAGQGDNWAFEALKFPLAWGCTTGSSSVRVGVVDSDFDPDADLVANTLASYQNAFNAYSKIGHGTRVLSLLGARGNNGSGMTGGMWNVSLEPVEVTDDGLTAFPRIKAAIRDLGVAGTRVINLSSGINWGYRPQGTQLQRYVQETGRLVVQEALDDAAAVGQHPLIVMSAGNDGNEGVTAWWNGFPAAADAYPTQVLTVGGASRQGLLTGSAKRAAHSNTGSYVHLYAPGEEVYSLESGGVVPTPESGTSFAAPLVTAIAGLLLSNDPTLTADSLRTLILAAAANSGVTIEGAHLADAYGALRLLARNENAPLCGNRLWSVGNSVYAERSSGPKLVGKVSADVGQVLPYHGGRKVLIQKGESARFAVYELGAAGAWDSTGLWNKDSTGLAGSGLSAVGIVHDRDSLVAFRNSSTLQIGTSYYDPTPRLIGQASTGITSASGETCVVQRKEGGNWRCDVPVFLSETSTGISSVQVTPVGETRLLWAQESIRLETTVQAAWLDCWSLQPANENSDCRFHERSTTVTHLGSSIWEMSRGAAGNGVAKKVLDIPNNRIVASITASEDGGSIAIATGASFIETGGLSDCQTQFYTYENSGQLNLSGAPFGYGASCSSYNWQGGFSAVQQQLTAVPEPSNEGFALQARLARTIRQ